MKRKIFTSILVIVLVFMITGCEFNNNMINNNTNGKKEINAKESSSNEVISSMRVIINGKQYKIQLEDNETAKSFINLLPQEYQMNELNGNEKYVYINNTLPTNSYNPKHIDKGDVMLYGNNCLVIFYKAFDTSYSYTKIGHIDNLESLEDDIITVKFEK